jgi:hypothetical protein
MQSRTNLTMTVAAATLTLLALHASADVQTKGQQKCIAAINKDVTKVVKAHGKDAATCIKDAGNGSLDGQSAQECAEADNKGKVAGAAGKTLADETKRCSPAPDFGYTSATLANQAALDEDLALLADVFGTPLEDAITGASGAKCQQKVAKAYGRLETTKLGEFLRCKKLGLKDETIVSGATLGLCLDTVASDFRGKVAKARAKVLKTLASTKCFAASPALDMAALFAGACATDTGDATALEACIDRQVECRICRMLSLVDGLTVNCDAFDDGSVNATCEPIVPTCSDLFQNQDETDVDCGGTTCAACADGSGCVAGSDCQSLVCTGNVCQAPTCSDGVANGTETGTDCGSTCPPCPDGSGCSVGSDCQSLVCTGNVCQAPTCSDGVTNQDESDVDCGGSCSPCADGSGCVLASDCESGVCTGNVCQVPTCSDGVTNQDESDVDCGGSCSACDDGSACSIGSDCQSLVCTGGVCQAPTCSDGVTNQDETDTDCGGSCPGCTDGSTCLAGSDCQSLVCTGSVCQVPTCSDGVTNGDESDTDCGGSCSACPDGSDCNTAFDCQSLVCPAGVCLAPTCADLIQNQDETDVDCGGTICAACADGSDCLLASDCQSLVCTGNVCQAPTCSDGIENGDESDTDCGGTSCTGCPNGGACNTGPDCLNGVCSGGICLAPTCSDSVENGAETDVDCGGGTCPACALGQGCNAGTDCTTTLCQGGVCSCGSQAFTFSITSNTGGAFDSAEWPGGTAMQNGLPGCSVSINQPSGNIDLAGTLGDDFEVIGFSGYSNCYGTGGEDGDGCQPDTCPPLGIPYCQDRRPSCSAALNGSGSARFFVQCQP